MNLRYAHAFVLSSFLFAMLAPAAAAPALPPSMQAQLAARPSAPTPLAPRHFTGCVDGMADIYP